VYLETLISTPTGLFSKKQKLDIPTSQPTRAFLFQKNGSASGHHERLFSKKQKLDIPTSQPTRAFLFQKNGSASGHHERLFSKKQKLDIPTSQPSNKSTIHSILNRLGGFLIKRQRPARPNAKPEIEPLT
jgi:hypothetical protein